MTENQSSKRGRPKGLSRCDCQCVGYIEPRELKRQLQALCDSGAIGHWWFIQHSADEDTRKDHVHVRLSPPPSRAVDWLKICSGIVQFVDGENLPRRLVMDKRAVNDKYLDGLLYARHDRRYCAIKGLLKKHYDYSREAFYTDDSDWLDGIWAESDAYEVEPKRLTKQDALREIDSADGDVEYAWILRFCLLNDLTQGDCRMLFEYACEVRKSVIQSKR